MLPKVRYRTGCHLANLAEHSHRSQWIQSAPAMIHEHFQPYQYLMTVPQHQGTDNTTFRTWRQETYVQMAA